MNFAKFLKTLFSQNTSYLLLLFLHRWRLYIHISNLSNLQRGWPLKHIQSQNYNDKVSETLVLAFSVLTFLTFYQNYLFYISKFSLLNYSFNLGRTVPIEDCLIKNYVIENPALENFPTPVCKNDLQENCFWKSAPTRAFCLKKYGNYGKPHLINRSYAKLPLEYWIPLGNSSKQKLSFTFRIKVKMPKKLSIVFFFPF